MSINTSLQVSIYKTFSDGDVQRPMEHWHCSSLAACPRAQYLQRQGIERLSKPSGAKVLRWQAGHSIEEAIRPVIETLYPGVSSNVRLYSEELDLTGEYDNYDKTAKRIIEIKSVHDSAFKEDNGQLGLKQQVGIWQGGRWDGKPRWGIKNEPYLHHQMQNHAYALLLKEQGEEVVGIDYIYISLSGRVVAYSTEIDYGGRIMLITRERIRVLNEAWKNQVAPTCICKLGDYDNTEHELWGAVLKWCDYRNEDDDTCCVYK